MRHKMLSQLQNQFKNDSRRGARIALLALLVSLVWVPILWMAVGEKPLGEMAATAAIPLIVSYLLLRTIGHFASDSQGHTQQRRESEAVKVEVRTTGAIALVFIAAACIFILGVWIISVAGASFLAYTALDIHWAASGSVAVILTTLRVVAVTAITISALALCRESITRIARVSHEIVNHPISNRAHQH
jgi:hypothetical protein